jgi:hypothetical protein
MTDDEVKSRLQIQEVIYTYCRGVDRGDVALIASAYHEDAYDDHGTFKGLGKDFAPHIVAQISAEAARFDPFEIGISGSRLRDARVAQRR